MKPPLVSILLVTFNSQKYLTNCLNSLTKISYQKVEIIVVDNNSIDKSKTILKKYRSKITLIVSTKNLGYAGGNELALKNAKGKYIFVINPDTKVTKNFLQPLVNTLEGNSQIGAAQPLVYLLKKPRVINLTGKITQFLGFDWIKDYGKTKYFVNQLEIESFSGSGVLFNKKIIKKIGFYDQMYFMYYEDTDLSWRLRLLNYQIKFVPESIIFHDYKYTPDETGLTLKQKLYFYERNRLITMFKNYGFKSLLLLSPALVVLELGMIFYFISKGWGSVKFKGYLFILFNWKKIMMNRRKVQKSRLANDQEIVNGFKAKLLFSEFQITPVKYFINPFLEVYFFFFKRLV